MFNPEDIKKDFPIFDQEHNGKKIVYLDNSATTQKPLKVIRAMSEYYEKYNANVSRSSHFLGEKSTQLYEAARCNIAAFLNAEPEEIIFTKNATESLNLVALSWGMHNLKKGDVILTTSSEHNSSLLPWKAVAQATGAVVKYLVVDKEGSLRGDWASELDEKVKVVVLTHVSNVLGVINPVKEICATAKDVGAYTVIDGSQAVSHIDLNMKSLGCDFYAFSGHKMMGPMGIGVLFGRREILKDMLPLSYGGGMVKEPDIQMEHLLDSPHRFEAGTPNVAGAIGLSEAINYISRLGIHNIFHYLNDLTKYAMHNLSSIQGLHMLGPDRTHDRSGLVSFHIDGLHSHDISAVLSNEAIAVRSGMHCSMNLYKDLQLPSSTRASFYVYNTNDDIDLLVSGIRKAIKILKR